MIKFSTSTLDDIEQIKEWGLNDPYHFHLGQSEWWLTGNGGMLAFCLMDEDGPLAYVRLDTEGDLTRLHTQFAPEEVVSKKRLVLGMIDAIQVTTPLLKEKGSKGIIFNSVSPSLIAFMSTLGFNPVGSNDYVQTFEEQN